VYVNCVTLSFYITFDRIIVWHGCVRWFSSCTMVADVQEGELVYDLGCGDGRVVVALANNSPAELIVGYEVSLIPYIWSRLRIIFLGLSKRIDVRYGDFLNRDLSSADVIFCFLTPMAMKRLQPKFEKELKKGTRIISYSFHIPRCRYFR